MPKTPPIPRRAERAEVPWARAVAWAAVMAALALCTPSPVDAQAPTPSREATLSALFAGLGPSSELRIATASGVVETGLLDTVGPDGVTVLRDGTRHEIDFRDVRTVAVRSGHGLQGALWGTGTGALLGGFAGALFASLDCQTQSGCSYTETQGAIRWGALFGVLGGGIGYFIGRRNRHWHSMFP